jgi:hypothetical protein
MPGLVPGIHVVGHKKRKTSMAGTKPGHDESNVALGPMCPAPRSLEGILQRGYKIFLALALEFLLGGSEVCHARSDFFALLRESVFLFGHAHPF